MSGTSADGVDAAIVEIAGHGLDMLAKLIHHEHRPYEPQLRQTIFQIRESGATELSTLARCGRDISRAYADAIREAVRKAALSGHNLAAVAAHGQTLYHLPPDTIQWLDPSVIAAEVGCRVVSDFRRTDCAAGGQGAPLVPFADYILFRHKTMARAVVNIGGIANVTCLFPDSPLEAILAFDVGPGNCISDYLMRQHNPNGPGVDLDGNLATSGTVHRGLYEAVDSDSYFRASGPKSTDGPAMIGIFLDARQRVGGSIPLADQLATACAVTASQIVRGLSVFGGHFKGEVIVGGGGTQNRQIMNLLARHVCGGLKTTDDLGVPSQAREAMAFALLGAATLDGVPSNVPSCTGAKRAVVLGSITPVP